MRKLFVVTLLVLSLLLGTLPAFGLDTELKVYDYADLLTGDEENALMERAREIAQMHRFDVVVVTTEDTGGKTYIDYADDFYDQNGFGYGKNADGILFLMDMESGMPWITYRGKAIQILDVDDVLDAILDPYFDGNYYEAANAMMDRVSYSLSGEVRQAYADIDTSLKVYDDADLFTEEEERELRKWAQKIASEKKMDVVLVTTEDTLGKSSMAYADDFFDYNGFGYGPDYDGVLLLINMDIREVWISTTGRGITAFTDAAIDDILDEMELPLSNDQFYTAARIFLKKAEYYASHGFQKAAYHIPGLLFISFIVAGLAVLGMAAQNKTMKTTTPATYLVGDSFRLRDNRDIYIRTAVTKRSISSSSGSGSGGSSTHRSSSGRSHGGGGRKF